MALALPSGSSTADSGSDLSSPPSSLPSSPPSSPLSSLASLSPSPPPEDVRDMLYSSQARSAYPSPPASQQTSQSGSPVPDGMDSPANATINSSTDGQPPKKRRRVSKERTTEHLDLRTPTLDPDQQEQLDRLLHVLHKRQKIVVIAGAGISVSAGIPDFRSAHGLFRSLKEEHNLKGSGKHLFDASVYKDDVSTSTFHEMVSSMSRLTKDAKPTAFHHMLATIAQEDRLLRLYSQNVDGIDTSLHPLKTCVPLQKEQGGKWPRTVQLHGGLDKMVCSKCQELSNLDPELFTGPVPPLCPRCEEINDIRTNHEGKRSHGIGRLRPRMVLYNEHNPDDEAIGAVTKDDLRKRPDAVIVVGTTLKVPGVRRIVREMCATVRDRRGGVAIWINNDPPPVAKDLEDCWDIIVRGPSDEVARYAAMRKWDEPVMPDEITKVISDEDARKTAGKALRVQLPSKKCDIEHLQAMGLPSAVHKNNSFRPTVEKTPRKLIKHSPPFSPVGSPPISRVIPSIEDGSIEGDTIAIAISGSDLVIPESAGLLTPSKSQRSTPINCGARPLISFTHRLQATGKPNAPAKKGGRKSDQAKTTGKPAAKAAKVTKTMEGKKKQPPARPNKSLTFKASKTPLAYAKDIEEDLPAPSKLRQVLNASSPPSEPMRPLSPNEVITAKPYARSNEQPSLLLSENRDEDRKRNRMRIENITN